MGSDEDRPQNNRDLIVRLNAMIALQIENMLAGGIIGKARAIELLYISGMGPTEIGELVDQPASNIGSLLSKLKKQRKSRGRSARKESRVR